MIIETFIISVYLYGDLKDLAFKVNFLPQTYVNEATAIKL